MVQKNGRRVKTTDSYSLQDGNSGVNKLLLSKSTDEWDDYARTGSLSLAKIASSALKGNSMSAMQMGNGFIEFAGSNLLWDDGTLTFTLDQPGDPYTVYFNGAVYSSAGALIAVITPAASGRWWFVLSWDAGTAALILTPTDVEPPITALTVASVYWNEDDSVGFLSDDRRLAVLPIPTREELNKAVGPRVWEGGSLSGYVLDSDLAVSLTFGIADISIELPGRSLAIDNGAAGYTPGFLQPLAQPVDTLVFYRAYADGGWTSEGHSTNPPLLNAGTGRLAYNLNGVGWSQAEATDGYYVNYWVVATNMPNYPVAILQGVHQYEKYGEALQETFDDYIAYVTTLPFTAFKLLARLTLQTDDTYVVSGFKAVLVDVSDMRWLNASVLPPIMLTKAQIEMIEVSGAGSPMGTIRGWRGQLYHNDTEVWVNLDGDKVWAKIYEEPV